MQNIYEFFRSFAAYNFFFRHRPKFYNFRRQKNLVIMQRIISYDWPYFECLLEKEVPH